MWVLRGFPRFFHVRSQTQSLAPSQHTHLTPRIANNSFYEAPDRGCVHISDTERRFSRRPPARFFTCPALQPPSGLSSSTREMLIMASRGSWKMSRVPLESSPRAVSKSQGPVRSLRGSRKAMFRKAVKTSEKHKESTQRAERSFIPPSLALHSLRFPLAPKLHAHHEAGRGCRHSVRHRSASAGHHPRLGRTILCHRDGGTLWIILTAGAQRVRILRVLMPHEGFFMIYIITITLRCALAQPSHLPLLPAPMTPALHCSPRPWHDSDCV